MTLVTGNGMNAQLKNLSNISSIDIHARWWKPESLALLNPVHRNMARQFLPGQTFRLPSIEDGVNDIGSKEGTLQNLTRVMLIQASLLRKRSFHPRLSLR
jgi:hypothetical protein